MDNQENSFEYTYSAPQQEEIKRIRQKYLPKEEDKMEQLRRLDQSAAQKGTAAALIAGILGGSGAGHRYELLHGLGGYAVCPRYHHRHGGHHRRGRRLPPLCPHHPEGAAEDRS